MSAMFSSIALPFQSTGFSESSFINSIGFGGIGIIHVAEGAMIICAQLPMEFVHTTNQVRGQWKWIVGWCSIRIEIIYIQQICKLNLGGLQILDAVADSMVFIANVTRVGFGSS